MSVSSDSPMSSPVSVPASTFTPSEIEPITSLDEITSAPPIESQEASNNQPPPRTKLVHPEFAFADANVEIETADRLFWIHEYQLGKFTTLVDLIKQFAITAVATLQTLSAVITGPASFDADALISTLRIATVYGYPELQEFAISGLEKFDLSAIERIQLSDELLLPSWEKPAFAELCQRPGAITPSEAQVLGVERFVQVARIREAEQRRQFASSLAESFHGHHLVKHAMKSTATTKGPLGNTVPSSLPACNCKVRATEDSRYYVSKCDLHKLVPQVVDECLSLLKERSQLADGLNNLLTTILGRAYSEIRVNYEDGGSSLSQELSEATWIRGLNNN
ncbi:hypothetical protein RhiJN_19058 [Ceratobasidium sp. AG-Ba]|nr:hypothetical protein RhiJN_04238 [Ceratobasidium sp. AG-Ba]QRV91040.1 hypothetical protein RhiJN_19058 [Ceratobasidium sp. AG-Ba]QRW05131.1 hypothetical protein RhiLY_04130 [Ceratobasidium sp. AG-Ba]